MAKKNASSSSALKKVRAICLALPDTEETPTWGKPHFRVADKIFAGCGEENGQLTLSFKLEKPHAAALVRGGHFVPAAYVGKHGWVSTDAAQITDWTEIAELIGESYRLIAPKTKTKKLNHEGTKTPRTTQITKTRAAAQLRNKRA